jgi:hypothetical protein
MPEDKKNQALRKGGTYSLFDNLEHTFNLLVDDLRQRQPQI